MRFRAPLWAFPRWWRERYGAEVRELLDGSSRPIADWIDLVVMGMQVRLEEEMRSLFAIGLAAAFGLSLVAAGYTLAELSDGVREVHRHWWSTAPYVVLAATGAMLFLLRRAQMTSRG